MDHRVYVSHMADTDQKVVAFENEQMLLIFAREGWTEADWDKSVPADFQTGPIAAKGWDYFTSEDDDGTPIEVWVVNK